MLVYLIEREREQERSRRAGYLQSENSIVHSPSIFSPSLSSKGSSNQHRYILATDSASIRHHLRNNVLGVPVLHHNDRGVMVMEPMSDLTQTRIEQVSENNIFIKLLE